MVQFIRFVVASDFLRSSDSSILVDKGGYDQMDR